MFGLGKVLNAEAIGTVSPGLKCVGGKYGQRALLKALTRLFVGKRLLLPEKVLAAKSV